MALVGVFISFGMFTGKAAANDTSPLVNSCKLTISGQPFANPPFAYADEGPITLDATEGTINLDESYKGYLYGATYYEQDSSEPKTLEPTYNPPTIVVSPGKSIDLTLTNDLPVKVELDGQLPQTEQNLESVSQDTNLHYHGFNVSPLLGSDDVVMHVHSNVTPKLESGKIPVSPPGPTTPDSKSGTSDNLPGGIYPGDSYPGNKYGATTEYQMQVNLPEEHQSGLFWYHPHVHTVSNNQVRAGMSGGIIVKEIEQSYTFLDPAPGKGIKPTSTITPTTIQPTKLAITQQVMMFKDFNDVLNPNYNSQSPRPDCFTFNGTLNPKITIQPGEVQFWRIANIGADNYLNLALETNVETNPKFAENGGFYILARDSDVVNKPIKTQSVLLPPASRVELLVVGGEPGEEYTLVSALSSNLTKDQQQWVNQFNKKSYYLATVSVEQGNYVCYQSPDGSELTPDGSACKSGGETLNDYITSQTPAKIDKLLPKPSDLASYQECPQGEKDRTKCITPGKEYSDPLTQKRYFYFSNSTKPVKNVFTIKGYSSPHESPTGELYNENRIDKVSHLGDIEEWQVINTTGAPHAFHMHQLDFLVTQVTLKDDPGSTYDNYTINGQCQRNNDSTYTCPLKPQGYRDTMNLPPNSTTTIRIPFLNPFITGVFVYHCHILDHEDKGMMQNLKVIDPKEYKSTSGLGSNS
ncbi:multicopper oxidase type 2 [Crinalium epipsammum PCC 9333]|uniref:Multicopper oxidase type 2 n=1 Tax=Crinalium epipsammum PCC 9333 TaxID=1173022 RepID=K9VUA0_9CYAN|nr:multicopper oxidase type 2 [Crinalium epipsammum PCC 9333]